MSCSRPPDPAAHAHQTRREMYEAAGLDVADKAAPPDRRFERAAARLGDDHPAVAVAVAARNDLAALAEPIVVAVARTCAAALPTLSRREAEQEGRVGALRAAELWSPSGGSTFRSYARRWIKKRVGQLADRSRAVTRPERARLAGAPIEVSRFDADVHHTCDPLEALEERAAAEEQAERLDCALEQLDPLERQAVRLAHGFDGRDALRPRAAADELGLTVAAYTRVLRGAHEAVRKHLDHETV